MAFYSFLHPHTDLPKEKLNLVFNKATYINSNPQELFLYHTAPPPPFPPQGFFNNNTDTCIFKNIL